MSLWPSILLVLECQAPRGKRSIAVPASASLRVVLDLIRLGHDALLAEAAPHTPPTRPLPRLASTVCISWPMSNGF